MTLSLSLSLALTVALTPSLQARRLYGRTGARRSWLLLHAEQRGGGGGGGGGGARGKAGGGGAAARQLRAAFASWSSAEAPLTRRWLDLRDAPAAVAVLARHRFVLCATANSALAWLALLAGATPVVRRPPAEVRGHPGPDLNPNPNPSPSPNPKLNLIPSPNPNPNPGRCAASSRAYRC